MTPHTPGPWKAVGKVYVAGPTGASIARMIVMAGSSVQKDCLNEETAQANAEYIVRAVNNHDELVSSLKAIIARISGNFDDPDLEAFGPLSDNTEMDILAIAKEAINQVEGKE